MMVKKEKIILVVWGVCCAFALVYPHLYTVGNGWIADFRAERLFERYMSLLENGKFDIAHNSHTLGYGLYFPYIMRWLNISDGKQMYCLAQSFSAFIVISVYPLLILKCFKSYCIALISPVIMHLSVGDMLYINKANEYFSGLWAITFSFPILFLLTKEKEEKNVMIYSLALSVIMMFSNVMRGHSGAPVLFLTVIILLAKWKKKILSVYIFCISITVMLVTYNFLSSYIPNIVASQWGVEGTIPYNSSPWHSILIGMGYIENDYGLYYDDDCARDLVAENFPNIKYNSDEYYLCCKEIAVSIIKKEPGFIILGLTTKFIDSIKLQLKYLMGISLLAIKAYKVLMVICILLLMSILLIKKRIIYLLKDFGFMLVEGCFLAIMGLYAGIFAIPNEYYEWGGVGCIGVLLAFLCFSLLYEVHNEGDKIK